MDREKIDDEGDVVRRGVEQGGVEPTEPSRTSPALFTALAAAVMLIAFAAVAVLVYMMGPRLGAWNPAARAAVTGIITAAFLLGAVAIIITLLSLSFGRDVLPFIPLSWRQGFYLALLPSCRGLGRILGRSSDEISASFISLCNRQFFMRGLRAPGKNIMVLLPRCLQDSKCPQRVVEDVRECRRCGDCDLNHLIGLMEKHGFSMAVVTGGQMARRLVRAARPLAVIAVACEEELVEGIRAVTRIPVVGLVNRRPGGPCRNTEVDLREFEEALGSLLNK